MGDEGSDYASHAEVRCENCRVPQTNLLGREGHGFAIAQEDSGRDEYITACAGSGSVNARLI